MKIIIKYIASLVIVFGLLFAPTTPLVQPEKADAYLGIGDVNAFDLTNLLQLIEDAVAYVASHMTEIANEAANVASKVIASDGYANEYVVKPAMAQLRKQLIDQIQNSMIAWINGGFKGKPQFMFNPEQIVKNMATEQLVLAKNSLLNDINGTANGLRYANRAIAKALILGARDEKNQLRKELMPDADKVIRNNICNDPAKLKLLAQRNNSSVAYISNIFCGSTNSEQTYNATIQCFSNTFSCGGWNAFLAFTQNPVNSEQLRLQRSIQALNDAKANEQKKTDDELNRGDGFFNKKECIEYYPNTDPQICKTWQNTTPSQALVSSLDQITKNPIQQLQLDDDITVALSAITGAFIGKISNEGLTAITGNINQAAAAIDANIASLNAKLNNDIKEAIPDSTNLAVSKAQADQNARDQITLQQQLAAGNLNSGFITIPGTTNLDQSTQLAKAKEDANLDANKTILVDMQKTLEGHKIGGEGPVIEKMGHYQGVLSTALATEACYQTKYNERKAAGYTPDVTMPGDVASYIQNKKDQIIPIIASLNDELNLYKNATKELQNIIVQISNNIRKDNTDLFKQYSNMVTRKELRIGQEAQSIRYNNQPTYDALDNEKANTAQPMLNQCQSIPLEPSYYRDSGSSSSDSSSSS